MATVAWPMQVATPAPWNPDSSTGNASFHEDITLTDHSTHIVYDVNSSSTQNETVEYDRCESTTFFFIVYGPAYGLICIFGLVGNTLSFAVLHKYSRNSVATYLLKALAIMDNLFLTTAALVQIYTAMAMYFNKEEQLEEIYELMQKFVWPLVHMVQMGTVWMMVLVASNRYIAVCLPLQAPRLCTKSKVQIQIVLLAFAIVIYNVPRFLEYDYHLVNVTDESTNTTELRLVNKGLTSQHLYNILYENVAYCLFVFLLPLIILIFFNVHLVRDLKKAQKSRRVLKSTGRSVEENNITLVMIIIIITFIICQTPASINQILFYVVDDVQKNTCSTYNRFFHLSNLLITTNSSLNFIIYCLFRRQFQQELRALICKHRSSSSVNGRPIRKTLLLRALHERTDSTYIKSQTSESLPLHSNNSSHHGNHNNHHHHNHEYMPINNHVTSEDCMDNNHVAV